MRLYVTPGADHVGTGAPTMVDMLDVLSRLGRARPARRATWVQVSLRNEPPHARRRRAGRCAATRRFRAISAGAIPWRRPRLACATGKRRLTPGSRSRAPIGSGRGPIYHGRPPSGSTAPCPRPIPPAAPVLEAPAAAAMALRGPAEASPGDHPTAPDQATRLACASASRRRQPWYSKDPKSGDWTTGVGVSLGKAMARPARREVRAGRGDLGHCDRRAAGQQDRHDVDDGRHARARRRRSTSRRRRCCSIRSRCWRATTCR